MILMLILKIGLIRIPIDHGIYRMFTEEIIEDLGEE